MVYNPPVSVLLPPDDFNGMISKMGQRIGWARSHPCPCSWSQSPQYNQLSIQGTPQRSCKTCLGVGYYWDLPTVPFVVSMSFRTLSPSPHEPGIVMDDKFGVFELQEPSVTIPQRNPYLDAADPQQPTNAWTYASDHDLFIAPDMTIRYSTMLQKGGLQNLPFQQNLTIASSGAVTVWDQATQAVSSVSNYVVSGATVTLPASYALGTSYFVEFLAASLFVAFRKSGGLPHVRPLAGGSALEPRVFRVQALDFWMRQRGLQPQISVGNTPLWWQI